MSSPSAVPGSLIGGRGNRIRVLDLVVVGWVIAWVVVGILVGIEVRNLRRLSDTVVSAGVAVEATGRALAPLGNLPLVGDQVSRVRGQIQAAGRSAEQSGLDSRDTIGRLSVLLTVSIILIPTVPLAAIYVPLRLSWRRDVRAVRRSLGRSADDPVFTEFLARRAAQHLPYHRLREITPNPWRDIESGRHDELARAELVRLGINPSLLPSGTRSAARG
jgi:hypothetical protein